MDTTDDRLLLIYNQGLQMLTEAFYTLHVMYHEATACHVTGDIVDLLSILVQVLKVGRTYIDQKKGKTSDYRNDPKFFRQIGLGKQYRP